LLLNQYLTFTETQAYAVTAEATLRQGIPQKRISGASR
jgi:hypothetical protein